MSARTRARDFLRRLDHLSQALRAHPDNAALRAAIASGRLTPAALRRQLVRALLRNVVLRCVEAKDAPARVHGPDDRGAWTRFLLASRDAAASGELGELLWAPESTPDLAGTILDDADARQALDLPEFVPDAAGLGGAYEALLAIASDRSRRGSFYTPPALVEHVLDLSLAPALAEALHEAGPSPERRAQAILALRVCDPCCGTGYFLIAAARRLATALAGVRHGGYGAAFADVVRSCIAGVDIDPAAAELCRVSLGLEAESGSVAFSDLARVVRCGNALDGHLGVAGDGYDVVVGNPPFLNQLESATAISRARARTLRERSGGAVRGYADVSAAVLALGVRMVKPGGRVAMVQPQSLLSASNAAPVRADLARRCALEALWFADERVFRGASVFTCVPAFRVGGARRLSLARSVSAAFRNAEPLPIDMDELALAPSWASLIADQRGIPSAPVRSRGLMGDWVRATADFRDQYYGLDGFVLESADLSPHESADDDAFPPLLTSGFIDLAHSRWGVRPVRILKRAWLAPRIDRRRMEREGELGPWLRARLVPKVLLATQTRIIEVLADPRGVMVPGVPIVSVFPLDPADVWRSAAALASPVVTAHALAAYGGAALDVDAIKMSARQVLALPSPTRGIDLEHAADAFRAASEQADESLREALLLESAEHSCRAFGIGGSEASELVAWWKARRGRSAARRRGTRAAASLTLRTG